ncbi:hypothetical protein CEXT_755041 [Caerostris extrusa]|uniref:Uncharacterized protein n=1 Tax=Caerostris extrusa TaxID=172846 RepID=A0AAV4U8N6_CAEEX|nr:hypothetical protein CEXT_755041 [Caerostris extrusa]
MYDRKSEAEISTTPEMSGSRGKNNQKGNALSQKNQLREYGKRRHVRFKRAPKGGFSNETFRGNQKNGVESGPVISRWSEQIKPTFDTEVNRVIYDVVMEEVMRRSIHSE